MFFKTLFDKCLTNYVFMLLLMLVLMFACPKPQYDTDGQHTSSHHTYVDIVVSSPKFQQRRNGNSELAYRLL